jgi:hypothetical protein
MFERASLALVATSSATLVACFEPDLGDGSVRCGEAGCPDGLVCASDGVCHTTTGDTDNTVLAVARANAPLQLYASCADEIQLAWELDHVGNARTLAWGDGDGNDSHRRLAIGSDDDDLYVKEIDGDVINLVFSSWDLRGTRNVAWADYDRDGDLDLALASGMRSITVLEHRRGDLETDWQLNNMGEPYGVAWGDVDGDGDLDLAVASANARVFRNEGDWFDDVWQSPAREERRSVIWADLDRDGDVDLVTGALAGPVRVHTNTGGVLSESWSSGDTGHEPALDAGDFDGDGDLDLAVAGRDIPSRVFRNDAGTLVPFWATPASETTASIAWFDVDNDGDLDLTLGNVDQPSRILRNDRGVLVDWITLDVSGVNQLAWARWSLDGDHIPACDVARWRSTPAP